MSDFGYNYVLVNIGVNLSQFRGYVERTRGS